jgi:hypothetical protein
VKTYRGQRIVSSIQSQLHLNCFFLEKDTLESRCTGNLMEPRTVSDTKILLLLTLFGKHGGGASSRDGDKSSCRLFFFMYLHLIPSLAITGAVSSLHHALSWLAQGHRYVLWFANCLQRWFMSVINTNTYLSRWFMGNRKNVRVSHWRTQNCEYFVSKIYVPHRSARFLLLFHDVMGKCLH